MLKRKNLTVPFYMDPWFWVKLMVFVIFAVFLVWPCGALGERALPNYPQRENPSSTCHVKST